MTYNDFKTSQEAQEGIAWNAYERLSAQYPYKDDTGMAYQDLDCKYPDVKGELNAAYHKYDHLIKSGLVTQFLHGGHFDGQLTREGQPTLQMNTAELHGVFSTPQGEEASLACLRCTRTTMADRGMDGLCFEALLNPYAEHAQVITMTMPWDEVHTTFGINPANLDLWQNTLGMDDSHALLALQGAFHAQRIQASTEAITLSDAFDFSEPEQIMVAAPSTTYGQHFDTMQPINPYRQDNLYDLR